MIQFFLCDSNRCDSKLQNFREQLFKLQNYSCAQNFRKCCCLQGFYFNFCFTMPWHSPVRNIKNLYGGILSPLFRPTFPFRPISVPLSILVLCGVVLLMFFDRFIGIPLFVFFHRWILFYRKFSDSRRRILYHCVPFYQWKRSLGSCEWAFPANALYLLQYLQPL